MKASSFLNLNLKDLVKGFILAVLTSVVAIISTTIEAGSLTFNWPLIGKTALLAGLGYLVKNALSNSKGEFMTKEKP